MATVFKSELFQFLDKHCVGLAWLIIGVVFFWPKGC